MALLARLGAALFLFGAPLIRLGAPLSRFGAPLLLISSLVVSGCGPGDEGIDREAASPIELADQEDAVCGMLVREQSAPRAQVIHRDGERAFFCSVGDLLVHLSAPSPHGSVQVVFVEVLRADDDPQESHTAARPWRRAEEATYVIGIDRPSIMGASVLAYASVEDARLVASRHAGARVVDLAELKQWWRALQADR